ncbi:12479_t:CDS:2 [Acaulospora colombiana]|uniref:12479_t:CDS:1 n=1 Tax=Acaulospora colombiana TaxID=27376 RepID=A0ACA9M5J6_9GLOM|nr:12479_t:CDS:2 [Acaulospora colombiana]
MQSYNINTSDYSRRSGSQRAYSSPYAQELNEPYRGRRYSRTLPANLKTNSRTYTTDDDDEALSVYSQSNSGAQFKPGKNGSADANGRHRSLSVNEHHYETDDENASSVKSNTHESSIALNPYGQYTNSAEMSEQNNGFKPIPGQFDVYNDFNNNRVIKSNDVLMDPPNDFEDDYTDRDFPGGGKSARQSVAGENLVLIKERKPLSIDGSQTLPSNVKPILKQQPPLVNLSMNVQVLVDNRANWVPYKFNLISVKVYDSASLSTYSGTIATGNVTNYTLQPRSISTLAVPINVFYQPIQSNDPTFQDLVSACVKNYQGSTQQALLNLQIDVTLYIAGIDWIYKPTISVPVSNFKCPYSLQNT